MNKVWRYTWIVLVINIAVFGLCLAIAEFFITDLGAGIMVILGIPALLLLIQFVLGIIFAAGYKRNDLGKGMLVAVGLLLLGGLSICSFAGFF